MGWIRKPMAMLLCLCLLMACAPSAALAAGGGAQQAAGGAQALDALGALDALNALAGTPVAKFDFGTEQSPVAEGWTKATPQTAYSAEQGYGWKNDARIELSAADESAAAGASGAAPDPLLADYVSGNNLRATINSNTSEYVLPTFAVDVPNGLYAVRVVRGSLAESVCSGAYIEENFRAIPWFSDALPVSYTAEPAQRIVAPAGEYLDDTAVAAVWDGQLTIEIAAAIAADGAAGKAVVNAIEIARLPGGGAPSEKPRLFVVGDSTAATYPPFTQPDLAPIPEQTGWGSVLGRFFAGDVEIQNWALGGMSAKNYLTEGYWNDVLQKLLPGDVVLVEWGINESAAGRRYIAATAADFDPWLRRYTDAARAAGATPILVSGTSAGSGYRARMAAVAQADELAYIDLQQLFANYKSARSSAQQGYLTIDGTHPSRVGGIVMAQIVANELKQLADLPISPYNTAAPVTAASVAPSYVPQNLRVQRQTESSLTLAWDAPESALYDPAQLITRFPIYRREIGSAAAPAEYAEGTAYVLAGMEGPKTQLTVEHIVAGGGEGGGSDAGAGYEYFVASRGVNGTGAMAGPLAVGAYAATPADGIASALAAYAKLTRSDYTYVSFEALKAAAEAAQALPADAGAEAQAAAAAELAGAFGALERIFDARLFDDFQGAFAAGWGTTADPSGPAPTRILEDDGNYVLNYYVSAAGERSRKKAFAGGAATGKVAVQFEWLSSLPDSRNVTELRFYSSNANASSLFFGLKASSNGHIGYFADSAAPNVRGDGFHAESNAVDLGLPTGIWYLVRLEFDFDGGTASLSLAPRDAEGMAAAEPAVVDGIVLPATATALYSMRLHAARGQNDTGGNDLSVLWNTSLDNFGVYALPQGYSADAGALGAALASALDAGAAGWTPSSYAALAGAIAAAEAILAYPYPAQSDLDYAAGRLAAAAAALEPLPATPPTLYLIGDSTVKYSDTNVGWGERLHLYLEGGATVSNHAIAGRSSKQFWAEGRYTPVTNALEPGDIVLIQWGHNDANSNNATRYAPPGGIDEAGTFQNYLKLYVEGARAKGAVPILVTVPATHNNGLWYDGEIGTFYDEAAGLFLESFPKYAQGARDVAAALGAPLIDLNAITKDWFNTLPDKAAGVLQEDGVHFTDAGATEIAKLIARDILQRGLPGAGYIAASVLPSDPPEPPEPPATWPAERLADRALAAIDLSGSKGGVIATAANDSGATATAGVYLSWRAFSGDEGGSYALYKNGAALASGLATTNYYDAAGTASDTYRVEGSRDAALGLSPKDVSPWRNHYLTLGLSRPASQTMPNGATATYDTNDLSVGDADGDGDYELIVKWYPSNAQDNSNSGYTGSTIIDTYDVDYSTGEAELMSRIDLGINIRSGAHYTQYQVWDYDGDGKAELMCKTADGTVSYNGQLAEVGRIGAASPPDYRNSSGYVLSGPEYVSAFKLETGEIIDTIETQVPRGTVNSWGDNYGNRVDRFLAATAYLDGLAPSYILVRGYYTRLTVAAHRLVGGKIESSGLFDTAQNNQRMYEGQGNHNMSVNDVDADGRDEILLGSLVLDDDLTPLSYSGLGHGDAMHVGDFIPSRPGLEIVSVQENTNVAYNVSIRDARTSEVLSGYFTGTDTGRGNAADIDPTSPGAEYWATSGTGRGVLSSESAKGADNLDNSGLISLSSAIPSVNFNIFWDGDLLREQQDHTYSSSQGAPTATNVTKWDYLNNRSTNLVNTQEALTNNGTKGNPGLIADILGDWREELVLREAANPANVRIFMTSIRTPYAVPTLMENRAYREGVAWQNTAYNQPANPDFLLSEGVLTAKLSARSTGANSVALSFEPASDGVLGHEITGYAIYRAAGTGTPALVASVALGELGQIPAGAGDGTGDSGGTGSGGDSSGAAGAIAYTYADEGLAASTAYNYRVAAIVGGVPSFQTRSVSVRTASATIVSVDSGFELAPVAAGHVFAPGETLAGLLPATIKGYDADGAEYALAATWDVSLVDLSRPGNYTVRATVAGYAGTVEKTLAVLAAVAPPTVPGNFALVSAGDGGAALAWSAVPDATYEVWAKPASEPDSAYALAAATATNSASLEGLEVPRNYYAKLRAVNALGASEFTDRLLIESRALPAAIDEDFEEHTAAQLPWTTRGGNVTPSSSGGAMSQAIATFGPTGKAGQYVGTGTGPRGIQLDFNEPAAYAQTSVELDWYPSVPPRSGSSAKLAVQDGKVARFANNGALDNQFINFMTASGQIYYYVGNVSDESGVPEGAVAIPGATATSAWYRLRVVLDFAARKLDVEIKNAAGAVIHSAEGLPFEAGVAHNAKVESLRLFTQRPDNNGYTTYIDNVRVGSKSAGGDEGIAEADKAALEALVAEAEALDPSMYVNFEAVEELLGWARDAIDDITAPQGAVDAAAAALAAAIADLAAAPALAEDFEEHTVEAGDLPWTARGGNVTPSSSGGAMSQAIATYGPTGKAGQYVGTGTGPRGIQLDFKEPVAYARTSVDLDWYPSVPPRSGSSAKLAVQDGKVARFANNGALDNQFINFMTASGQVYYYVGNVSDESGVPAGAVAIPGATATSAWYHLRVVLDFAARKLDVEVKNAAGAVIHSAEGLPFEAGVAHSEKVESLRLFTQRPDNNGYTTYIDNVSIGHAGGGGTEPPAPADKTALKAAIAEAQAIDGSLYTDETAGALVVALKAATDADEDAGATQEAVDAAEEALAAAIEDLKLKPVDRSGLEDALEDAGKVDASLYTTESLIALGEAVGIGQLVLADAGATQGEVNAAADAITEAIAALVDKPEPPVAANKDGLKSVIKSADKIETDLFTPDSVKKFEDAEKDAWLVRDDVDASQDAVNKAQSDLAVAIAGLAVAPEHAALGELAALLIHSAQLDGSLYTDASWEALQLVVDEAWAYIKTYLDLMETLAGPLSEEYAPLEAGELLAGALGAALAPMADVDPAVAEFIMKLQQALAALVFKPSATPEPGAGMEAGVYSAEGVLDLVAEDLAGNPEAEFSVKASNFANVGSVNVRLTFKEADVAAEIDGEGKTVYAAEIALPAELEGLAAIRVTDRGNEFAPGYRTYSIVLTANPSVGSGTLTLADGAELLVAKLTASSRDAKVLSLVLNYLDVVYYEGGGETIALSAIAPSVATTAIRVASRFDVNLDGAVTLADVDAVRRRLGLVKPAEGWATTADERSDLKPDGVIDIEDLTQIIGKYESLIP